MSNTVVRAGAERLESAADEPSRLAVSERGRFRPGQSGNPRGRPRKRVKEQSALDSALDELVTIKDGRGTRKIPVAQVIAKRLVQKAMTGDISAMKLLKAESPKFLTAVLEAGPGEWSYAAFMQHVSNTMSLDALREFRDAMDSWHQSRLANTRPGR